MNRLEEERRREREAMRDRVNRADRGKLRPGEKAPDWSDRLHSAPRPWGSDED